MQRMRRLRGLGTGLALGIALGALACSGETADDGVAVGEYYEEPPIIPVPEVRGPRDIAEVTVRDHGTIRFELLRDVAPEASEHFAGLASEGYYEGTTFHRVIPGFMIQGGDPNSRDRDPRNDGLGGMDRRGPDEYSEISHLAGIVAFANTGRPGSAGSQFFIMVGENRTLDGRYTIFGRVVEGQDVAEAIALSDRDQYGRHGPRDRPLENIVIESVRIETEEAARHEPPGAPYPALARAAPIP